MLFVNRPRSWIGIQKMINCFLEQAIVHIKNMSSDACHEISEYSAIVNSCFFMTMLIEKNHFKLCFKIFFGEHT